jgi:hypothetical protein
MPLYPSVAKKMKISFGTANTTNPSKPRESSDSPLYPWVAQQMKIRFDQEDHAFEAPLYGMAHTMARPNMIEKPFCPTQCPSTDE